MAAQRAERAEISQSGSASKPTSPADTAPAGRTEPLVYAVCRITCLPDGQAIRQYHFADQRTLDEKEFNDWLTQDCRLPAADSRLAFLAVREFRDQTHRLQGFVLERRLDSCDGKYFGDPARVEVSGAGQQVVQGWRAGPDGELQPVAVPPVEPPGEPTSHGLFAGELAAVRAVYGADVVILSDRAPTPLEDFIGFASIARLQLADAREVTCGIGWHGTTAFLIEGDFARIPPTPAPGLRDQLTADQVIWLNYVERYEHRVPLEARADGTEGEVLVLTEDVLGRQTWHRIDADGVELWRRPASRG